MAGGGTKAGYTYGETDELGFGVATDGVHVHDYQATVLHLLGLDHLRTTLFEVLNHCRHGFVHHATLPSQPTG